MIKKNMNYCETYKLLVNEITGVINCNLKLLVQSGATCLFH